MEDLHTHDAVTLDVIAPNHADGAATDAAYSARNHDIQTYRTNAGRSTFRVTRRGRAQVVGSWTHDADGNHAWSGAVASVVGTRVGSYGTDPRSVLDVTARMFGAEIEPLLGTDTTQWAQVGRSGYYGRPLTDADERYWNPDGWADRCDVTERHVWQPHDADHNLRGTSQPTTAPWGDRVTSGVTSDGAEQFAMPLGPDRAGESRDAVVLDVWTPRDLLNDTRRAVAMGAQPARLVRLVSPGDEPRTTRYHGHDAVTRPIAQRAQTSKTTARTVGTDRPVADAVAIVDAMRPGDRVTLTGRYAYVITRGDSGRYAYDVRTHDGTPVVKRGGVRSGYGTASRVLELDARGAVLASALDVA